MLDGSATNSQFDVYKVSSDCIFPLEKVAKSLIYSNVVDIPKDVNFLLAGEGPLLVLSINVTNRGEEAHRARIILHLPPGVTYKNSTTVYKVVNTVQSRKSFFVLFM